jgi:hypothetical protein
MGQDVSGAVLAEQLASQTERQRRLLSLVRAQRDALRRGDVEALRTITADQEEAVLGAALLERDRDRHARALAESLGLDPGADASEIAAALPEGERNALEQAAEELRAVVAELTDVSHGNRMLVEQELRTIDHLVREVVLRDRLDPDDLQAGAPARPRLLDREA